MSKRWRLSIGTGLASLLLLAVGFWAGYHHGRKEENVEWQLTIAHAMNVNPLDFDWRGKTAARMEILQHMVREVDAGRLQ